MLRFLLVYLWSGAERKMVTNNTSSTKHCDFQLYINPKSYLLLPHTNTQKKNYNHFIRLAILLRDCALDDLHICLESHLAQNTEPFIDDKEIPMKRIKTISICLRDFVCVFICKSCFGFYF